MNLVISHPQYVDSSHFSPSIYRLWVPREHNSSYNFIPIFLKLCTCFLLNLKMCMCFSYNPCFNFCHFFYFFNFVIFSDVYSGYLVIAISHTILNQSFWNFARFPPSLLFIIVTFSSDVYFSSLTSHALCEKMHSLFWGLGVGGGVGVRGQVRHKLHQSLIYFFYIFSSPEPIKGS